MPSSSKPRRKMAKAWNAGGVLLRAQPWKMRAVLRPVEDILDELERDGTINVSRKGEAIYCDDRSGDWYESVPALRGLIEAYGIHERRVNRSLGLYPLHALANKLEYGMPITSDDTRAARAAVENIRRESLQMTSEYADRLVKDYLIKTELEKVSG